LTDIRAVRHPRAVRPTADGTTPADPWATERAGYSPERFYTSSGGRDHGTVQIALPVNLLTEIDRLVQSGQVPEYQTRQDVIRDALVHRLRFVAEELKRMDAMGARRLNTWIQLATVRAIRAEKNAREEILKELEDALKEAERTRDLTQIAEIFEAQEPIIASFPVDQRERGMRVLESYRHLIEEGEE